MYMYLYIQLARKIVHKIEGAMLEKDLNYFKNFKTKIFIFKYFPKKIVRNKLHSPFLAYFDTQHLICKNFHFVRRGFPKI